MPAGDQSPDRHPWTLLSSHGRGLLLVAQRPTITIRRIADVLGFSERAISGVIADLEQAGMLSHQRLGRGSMYQALPGSARLPWSPQRTAAQVVHRLTTGAPVTPPATPPAETGSTAAPTGAPENA